MKKYGWIGLSLLFLCSCSDFKKTDDSCADKLDQKKFDEVVNGSCSNYEKSSAYLGKAGWSLSNLLDSGASANFSGAIALQSDWENSQLPLYRRALCLVGPDNYVQSECSGIQSRSVGSSRTSAEIEISFFGQMGELLMMTYGNLDLNLNGNIEENETKNFVGVSAASNPKDIFQLASTNNISEIVIDNISLNLGAFNFVDQYALVGGGLSSDLAEIGIPESSGIAGLIDDSLEKMDNGEKGCSSNLLTELQKLGPLLDSVVKRDSNPTAKNQISANDLSTYGVVPGGITGLVNLVYKSDNDTEDFCDNNSSDVCKGLLDLINFAQPSIAGDRKITLGELVCFSTK